MRSVQGLRGVGQRKERLDRIRSLIAEAEHHLGDQAAVSTQVTSIVAALAWIVEELEHIDGDYIHDEIVHRQRLGRM